MTEQFDPRIQELFDDRLSRLPAIGPRPLRPRRASRSVTAAGLTAAVVISGLGLGTQVNAAAEQEGISCADIGTKVEYYLANLTAGQLPPGTVTLGSIAAGGSVSGAMAITRMGPDGKVEIQGPPGTIVTKLDAGGGMAYEVDANGNVTSRPLTAEEADRLREKMENEGPPDGTFYVAGSIDPTQGSVFIESGAESADGSVVPLHTRADLHPAVAGKVFSAKALCAASGTN